MYLEINPYQNIKRKENDSNISYMVQICQNYNCKKEEMIDKLILDLESLKSKLEEERYKKLTLKK